MKKRQLNNEKYEESIDNCEDRLSNDDSIAVNAQPASRSKTRKPGRVLAIWGIVLSLLTPVPFFIGLVGAAFACITSILLRMGTLVPLAMTQEWFGILVILILPAVDLIIAIIAVMIPFYICIITAISALSLSAIAITKKCKLGIIGLVISVLSMVAVILVALAIIISAICLSVFLFIAITSL